MIASAEESGDHALMSVAGTVIEPYVQHIRDELWRTPGRGLASVMVGAGFSRNADPSIPGAREFPLWDQLAHSMASGIGIDKDAKPRDPLQIAEMYDAMLGRAELHRLIERHIPDTERRPGELHRRLMSLPWADVFTTNYDTLLERTFSDRNYCRIVTPKDIAMRQPPRLVKLHGTLGSGGKLIATQEDYRCYPQTHAPFVNLVRQAVMETVFVLIGFTGDDPNFLEWIGWVRDILGDDAPKIYLCGLLDDSAATRALLVSRRVTPIDLSGIAARCTTGNRHAFALDWFLAALESGKPGRALEWAPRESSVIERDPSLPAAKLFTPFSGYPKWSPGAGFDVNQLKPASEAWRAQRDQYPGWHVAPDSVRDRVWHAMPDWRVVVFHHSEKLPLTERLLIAREVCWRLELCLSPIFTDETDKLVLWLEAINPFGERLDLANAAIPNVEDAPALREAWVALALHVLRTAREDLDEERYRTWRNRLMTVAADDVTIVGELHHEEAQRHLNRLDLAGFRAALATWRATAKQPLELARLAALFAEVGDSRVSEELAIAAVKAARADKSTYASVSLEAWCCLLLDALHWHETKKTAEWRERIEVAKEQGYNPWETIETLRTELKAPRPQRARRIVRQVGFDAGDVRQSVRLAGRESPEMAAWQLLRLLERAPCPIYAGNMGFFGETAAHAAVWIGDGAPFWSLAMLLRTGAKPEVLHEVFDRAAIAILKAERIGQLFTQLLRVVDGEIAGIDTSAKIQSDVLGQRMLKTALDLLSRLALRLGRSELDEIATRLARWLSTQAVMVHHDLRDPLNNLLDRLVEALPNDALVKAVELLLPVPILGEANCQLAFDHNWPEPFDAGALNGRNVKPPASRTPHWSQTWTRLIEGVRSSHTERRERAFMRAYFLHANGWLDPTEQTVLGEAVWSNIDASSGLPIFRQYRRSVVLHIPQASEHDAAGRLRRVLLGRPLVAWKNEAGAVDLGPVTEFENWLIDLNHVFCHPALVDANAVVLPLDAKEAAELLERLIVWWPVAMEILTNPRWRDLPFGGFKPERIADKFCRVLGESLLLFLPRGHELGAKTEELLAELAKQGFSIAPSTCGRLYQRANLLDHIVADLERALLSDDTQNVCFATRAIDRWQRAARALLLSPVPRVLVGTLVGRVLFRRLTALDTVIDCLTHFVEANDGQIGAEYESQLLLGLELLADETAAVRLRERLFEGEIERPIVVEALHARSWAALLAKKLAAACEARSTPVPEVLRRWRAICESDTLPETRRAWDATR